MKLVAAGNLGQAEYWAKQLGWNHSEWKYFCSRRHSIGLPAGTELHYFGTGYENHPSRYGKWNEDVQWRVRHGWFVIVRHEPDTGEVIEEGPSDAE